MTESFFITFRETLEAVLVVCIVFSWIKKTGQKHLVKSAWIGVFAGITGSVVAAFLFMKLAGGFKGRAEEIFEGVTMLIGAALLVSMIVWMTRQKNQYKEKIEKRIEESAHATGVFTLVFVSILREGVETVIFLAAANFASQANNQLGVLFGIVAAATVGYVIFKGSLKINLRHFFTATSIVLMLIAGNLMIQAAEELKEAWLGV